MLSLYNEELNLKEWSSSWCERIKNEIMDKRSPALKPNLATGVEVVIGLRAAGLVRRLIARIAVDLRAPDRINLS